MRINTRWTVLLLLLWATAGHCQYWAYTKPPDGWTVVSPQAGGVFDSPNPQVIGATISRYFLWESDCYFGVGLGAYYQEKQFAGELLGKFSAAGLLGASVGPSLYGKQPGITGDLWANAIFVGLRWRSNYSAKGKTNSLMVFVPLWWLMGR